MSSGGRRDGAGRKRASSLGVKESVTIRLTPEAKQYYKQHRGLIVKVLEDYAKERTL